MKILQRITLSCKKLNCFSHFPTCETTEKNNLKTSKADILSPKQFLKRF